MIEKTNDDRPLTDDELLAVTGGWATQNAWLLAVERSVAEGFVTTAKALATYLP
jgi:hypothetical protein